MNKLHSIGRLGLALAVLSPALFAQQRESLTANVVLQVTQDFASWNEKHGSNWHTYSDIQTGYAQFIFGGSTVAPFEPISDADFADLGRLAIEETAKLHGIESGTLTLDRTLHLPLGWMDSSDKFTVRFRQDVKGVPVLGGYMNTLFAMSGELLSVQTTAMPGVATMSTDAVVSADGASKQALAAFEKAVGLPGTIMNAPTKAIGQLEIDHKHREAVLVWEVDVQWHGQDMEPEGTTYWIDARNGGIIREQDSVHNFDVGGTVTTMASPGVLPDQNNNPEAPFALNRARVTGAGAGTVFTDVNGNFNFPGVSGPLSVTFEYFGDWADVRNNVGADHTENFSLTGTGNNVVLNTGGTAFGTSESSAFQVIGLQRDYIRAINPSDSTGDFRALSNNNLAATCNAYFNGNSVNFYQQGGGCNATSYSTVVAHEMGHWYNVKYGTGNGSDGMGEGNSDIWGLYMYNSPFLGLDFEGQGSGALRNGNNSRQFCGDANPGCYGGVHDNGEPWMGAAWKVYRHIETDFDSATADIVTDQLFMGWMNAYDQTQIRSVIETQWLTLDDDNGNINDGTPHYTSIDDGFKQQGWPGFDLPLIDFVSLSQVANQLSELGPYVVNANVVSLISSTITGVDLKYSVNGGAFTTLAMNAMGPDNWTVGIPGQISPAVVRYYAVATDALNNTETEPETAPTQVLTFVVGVENVFLFEDFEGGQAGWVHNTFGDTSNAQDDWQFGTPGGQSGDPSTAASGVNTWGNDLSIGTFNGAYQDNVHNFVRSPGVDLTAATGTRLRFKRWLTVEEAIYDQARVSINGTVVWTNPNSGHLLDSGWTNQEIDISQLADGNPNVRIEFSLQSDGSLVFGGWTIDDVELLTLGPVDGSCIPSVNYGQGKLTSVFTLPTITTFGNASEAIGSFSFDINGAVPNVFGMVFSSAAPDSAPLFGGTRLVAFPIQREGVFQTDAFGLASVGQAVEIGSSGSKRYYQSWFRDPAHQDGTGAGLTDGVEVTFCD
ncbi:MAG: hypothetical protein ACI9F9_001468 [Candidatus Paceibacteria bacterium]|jgi:hypothetical protein